MAQHRKTWIVNAFTMNASTHMSPGLWRLPEGQASNNDLDYWVELAKLLESAKFDGSFIADTLGLYDVYQGPENIGPALKSGAQVPYSDPSVIISAMSYATKSIAFGVTASVTYENPFVLARRYSTLDHITKGRIGWNIVTSHLASAARNCGLKEEIPHDERYVRAEEFMDVAYKLWEGSWRDDALVRDKERGVYIDPKRVRAINHEGKYFSVTGPNAVDPTSQRTPFLFQAGASTAGKSFATKHAEVMFLPGMTPESVRKIADEIRHQATLQGRSSDSIKLLAGMLVIVDETDEKAQQNYHDLLEASDFEGVATLFGGWTGTDLSTFSEDEDFHFTGPGAVQSLIRAWSAVVPGSDNVKWTKRRVLQELTMSGAHPRVVGEPHTVANALERWIEEGGIDGFNFSHATSPGTFQDMVKWLWPELRKRGFIKKEYSVVGGTARENYTEDGLSPRLRSDHPGATYTWRKPETER